MPADPPNAVPSRDDLATRYLDVLPFDPYPVQEEALLAWFSADEGVLVCAPTGTGKTIIAEAALFEALHTGTVAYYTTPLIALTEQKFHEMQAAAERWGFSRDDVGLVTGNRRVNPDARVLVVVAEILLNRLLHPAAFDFSNVSAVVMDEFHSFNDPERGVVWELSLGLLPKHVRLLLLSATVGNTAEFLIWLQRSQGRRLELVQSTDRKVPLYFEWVGDELLNEHLERMSDGDDERKRTPTLLFCFNRSECWDVAEQLKGKSLLADGQQKLLAAALEHWDWKQGAGPKLRPLLLRGVGVHHAGLLPKYRRRVEELFQQKLLSVCVCTETLASGINLPARSVVLTSLVKGPPGKKKIIDPSTAHQIFGRAGRPQFDKQGYAYALAHEDDVKIARWRKQYDQIPEDTKDPNLIPAQNHLTRKMPTRRTTETYWNEDQFRKLIAAPPAKLASRGELPWRLLAYLLEISPDVDRLRRFVRRRLLDPKHLEAAEKRLQQMLLTLWSGGYVELDPPPPVARTTRPKPPGVAPVVPTTVTSDDDNGDVFGAGLFTDEAPRAALPAPDASDAAMVTSDPETPPVDENVSAAAAEDVPQVSPAPSPASGTLGSLLQAALFPQLKPAAKTAAAGSSAASNSPPDPLADYVPHQAVPTPLMDSLFIFRSVNPIYGQYLIQHFDLADPAERLQLMESVLELPGSIFMQVRMPGPDEVPPGPLARERVDPELIARGLLTAEQIDPTKAEAEQDKFGRDRRFAVPLADKVRLLFGAEFPDVFDLRTSPVWVAGDLLHFAGDFNKYVTSRDLTKQEGLVFRHLLRLILLCGEFSQLTPPNMDADAWRSDLRVLSDQLTSSCRAVDPDSTDKMLESMQVPDIVTAEATVK